MKLATKGLSITHKFLLFLAFLMLLAVTDSIIFINESRQIEFYDDLNYRINDTKFSLIKLDYILDIFVVAHHFELEQAKLKSITEDDVEFEKDSLTNITDGVADVDENIRKLETLGFTKFFDDSLINEGIKYLIEDWHTVKNEFSRLDGEMSTGVIYTIHDKVDKHTMLFTEKTEKLLGDISKTRKGVFRNIKVMVLVTLVVSVLIALIATFVFMIRGLYPIKELAGQAMRLAEGDDDVGFNEDTTGEAAILASAMNRAGGTARKALRELEQLRGFHESEIDQKEKQILVLKDLSETAGESLSKNNVYNSAVNGVLLSTGAEGAAIYLAGEDEALNLVASSGAEGGFLDEVSVIPLGERLIDFEHLDVEVTAREVEEYPDSKLKSFLQVRRCDLLVTVPISYDKKPTGVLLLDFKETGDYSEEKEPFLKTVASFIGAIVGYLNTFYKEYEMKSFLERIVDQSPLGLAVFDVDGVAVMLNSTLKRMLGVAEDSDFIGKYKIFDDNVLDREGITPLIREAYDGLVNESEFNYNPAHLTWYDFSAQPMRLNIKTFPLYDAGGGVSGIAILYDDLRDHTTISSFKRRATDQ